MPSCIGDCEELYEMTSLRDDSMHGHIAGLPCQAEMLHRMAGKATGTAAHADRCSS